MNRARTVTIAASAAALCVSGVALPLVGIGRRATTPSSSTAWARRSSSPSRSSSRAPTPASWSSSITWSSWTANGAKGVGTLAWNTCLPETCVDGIVQKYKVKVILGGVASAPNVSVFSQMTLAFPKGGPAAAETATYTLDRPIG